jgi:hypoxanthine phosphoribosyltransferase|tara:strand:+ start:2365 stop:2814 length:450 start_codon:yes stop_codon:yes gene_type:complete
MVEKAFIDWAYVDNWVNKLAELISENEIKYDYIVALGRGGLIPGAMLSYKLGIKNLQNLGINTRQEDGKYLETLVYQRPTISGNVLVVDDINDSGKTFEAVDSLISKEYSVDQLTYCSIVKRYSSTFKKDTIQAVDTSIDDWFVFPWDK